MELQNGWRQRDHGFIEIGRGRLIGKSTNQSVCCEVEEGVILPAGIKPIGNSRKIEAYLPIDEEMPSLDDVVSRCRNRMFTLLYRNGNITLQYNN